MDRISDLPHGVLHRILLLLPTKDAVRTITLSHTWRCIWHSVPILPLTFDFHGDANFIDFLDDSTRLLQRALAAGPASSIRIVSLRLHIPRPDPEEEEDYDSIIDHYHSRVLDFIQLIDRSKILVEELSLVPHDLHFFDLPAANTIFRFKSLTCLKLCNMSLQMHPPLFLENDVSCFANLKDLQLVDVDFDDVNLVHDILSRCPVLEVLVLEGSHEGNGQLLRLQNLPNVKKVKIVGSYRIEINGGVDLRVLSIHSVDIPLTLDAITNCDNLRELDLSCPMTNRRIQQVLVKFPFLESLSINYGLNARKINISSDRLKKLVLCFDSYARDITLDAPNLSLYEERLVAIPSSFRVSGSSQLRGTFLNVLSERVT